MIKETKENKSKKNNNYEEDDSEIYKGKELLIDVETYLKSGIHLGTKFKSGDMRKYIFKKRKDGLIVFNIETIDKRIREVAKLIANTDAKEIAVVCRRLYGQKPAKKFASMIGAKSFTKRFIPGTITNPLSRSFYEPKLVIVGDTGIDSQALKEAAQSHLPLIAIAGSESSLKNVDIVIPANNKGRKAIALIFYLLTREVLVQRGEIDRNNFKVEIDEFEQKIKETDKKQNFKKFDRRSSNRTQRNNRR